MKYIITSLVSGALTWAAMEITAGYQDWVATTRVAAPFTLGDAADAAVLIVTGLAVLGVYQAWAIRRELRKGDE